MSAKKATTIFVIALASVVQLTAQPRQPKTTAKPFAPPEVKQLWQQANELAKDPRLLSALGEAAGDPRLAAEAQRSPVEFLRSRGVKLPDTLSVNLFDPNELGKMEITPGKPAPDDFYFFTMRLFNCRTFWVWNPPNKPERITVCLGFEIVPNYLPPIARVQARRSGSSG
jgi:hypothetical protein